MSDPKRTTVWSHGFPFADVMIDGRLQPGTVVAIDDPGLRPSFRILVDSKVTLDLYLVALELPVNPLLDPAGANAERERWLRAALLKAHGLPDKKGAAS